MTDIRRLVDNYWRLMEQQIGKNDGGTELWQNWVNIVDEINKSGNPHAREVLSTTGSAEQRQATG